MTTERVQLVATVERAMGRLALAATNLEHIPTVSRES
jgi:hypothetical protein